MTFVEYVASNLMEHVPHASILGTTALFVSSVTISLLALSDLTRLLVIGTCGHSFHMVDVCHQGIFFDMCLLYLALSPHVDPTRFIEGIVSDVQAK